MSKTFKPLKFPNIEVELDQLKYPLLASIKLDGIRGIFKDGKLYSASLKLLPNRRLDEHFRSIKEYSSKHNVILEGELYSELVDFNTLSGIIRSDDHELPGDLHFRFELINF